MQMVVGMHRGGDFEKARGGKEAVINERTTLDELCVVLLATVDPTDRDVAARFDARLQVRADWEELFEKLLLRTRRASSQPWSTARLASHFFEKSVHPSAELQPIYEDAVELSEGRGNHDA